ncbi:hypothetical protein HKBW3S42_01284, partial [Candidatus Hakubella thermalkaliphila]
GEDFSETETPGEKSLGRFQIKEESLQDDSL